MLLFAQTVCFFSVSSWVWLRGLDIPEISAAVCPILQKQRSPPSRPGQQWSACTWVSPFCPASIPTNVYSVLCVPSRSWNHAGSWEADRGRLRVPLRPQLPGPLPVDQPTAGRPEDVWQTRPVLQDSQHVLCYALLGNHADGRLKQEVQAGRSHSCALKFAVISKVPMICRPPPLSAGSVTAPMALMLRANWPWFCWPTTCRSSWRPVASRWPSTPWTPAWWTRRCTTTCGASRRRQRGPWLR